MIFALTLHLALASELDVAAEAQRFETKNVEAVSKIERALHLFLKSAAIQNEYGVEKASSEIAEGLFLKPLREDQSAIRPLVELICKTLQENAETLRARDIGVLRKAIEAKMDIIVEEDGRGYLELRNSLIFGVGSTIAAYDLLYRFPRYVVSKVRLVMKRRQERRNPKPPVLRSASNESPSREKKGCCLWILRGLGYRLGAGATIAVPSYFFYFKDYEPWAQSRKNSKDLLSWLDDFAARLTP